MFEQVELTGTTRSDGDFCLSVTVEIIDGRLPPGIRTELSGPDSSPVATDDEDRSPNVDDDNFWVTIPDDVGDNRFCVSVRRELMLEFDIARQWVVCDEFVLCRRR